MPIDKEMRGGQVEMRGTAAAPWQAAYEPGVPRQLRPPDTTFHAILEESAASAPALPAVTRGLRETRYGSLQATVERVSAALLRHGPCQGETVRVDLPAVPEALAALLGALRAGASVSANQRDEPHPATTVITTRERAAERPPPPGARVVILDPARGLGLQERLLVALGRLTRSRPPAPSGAVAWPRWLDGDRRALPPVPEVARDAPALWERGIAFRHAHLVAGVAQLRAWLVDALSGEETWLSLCPPVHRVGLVATGAALAYRARLALLPTWSNADALDALRFLRPSWVISDGDAIERLARDPRLAVADVRSVRAWLVAGPVAEPAARAFEEAAGIRLSVGWAPRGAAGLVCCAPLDGRRSAGSVGLPLPGVDVRAAAGRVRVAGPNVVRDDVSATGTVDSAGWVHLGGGVRDRS